MASIVAGTLGASSSGAVAPIEGRSAVGIASDEGCLRCHDGIEEMHPGFPLSCTDCHGGDPDAKTKGEAHVKSTLQRRQVDERVAPEDQDLAFVRFINPMDLRVAEHVCGDCHGELVNHLMLSLHGTTAAHLSDGFFETGIQEDRDSRYAVFPVRGDSKVEGNTIESLVQPPKVDSRDAVGSALSCLLYTSPSPRDRTRPRMPSSA